MASIEEAAKIILEKSLGLNKGEKVLVITDENLMEIGEVLYNAALEITDSKIIKIPVGKVSGEEPPVWVNEEVSKADVLLIPTTQSLTHTAVVKDACKRGARVVTLPGITKETMERAINVDYEDMAKRSNKLKDILDKGKKVRIVTKLGTDIKMSIDSRDIISSAGMLKGKGTFDNLPSGEVFVAPVEGTADGKYIIDASTLNQKVDEPVIVVVENGMAVSINGGMIAAELQSVLNKINDKNAFNIAELGIGTNLKAQVCGNVLEDEKVAGTCHIALGKNSSFGGNVDVPVHIDGIILKPTIYVDGVKIMEDGKIL